MGLFSNNRKGKGSHPFFHKSAKSTVHPAAANTNPSIVQRTARSVLFVKQYDIMSILKEILMPQNQN
ncbi:hypothetical protein [Sphingobacterium sp. DR205]|uniref:hypothetical protein n=1 Tax=Sphingobacterium sp. DR205 TaxID=2713573 RepID=UPI0013E50587|nr:hypothetical protein [Sphingobacterium sp. DR205]QIH33632.1 hypothetical protein G6053_12385 [Sphingobacterium sp. DR205]